LKAFDYLAAHSIEQAISMLSQNGENACVLNGGTDLIVQMREGRKQAGLVVDIKGVPEANQLAYDPVQGLVIGAAAPCRRICDDPVVAEHYPGLVDAVSLIGGVQIQSRASLGGNLCNASPAADSIPALIVHAAVCMIAGRQGRREVAVESFCTAPGQTILQTGEFLLALRLPPPPARFGAAYLRFTPRSEMDIAVAGAAAAVTLAADGTTFTMARIALGGVAPTPLPVPEAGAALAGQLVTGAAVEHAAQIARQAARPISDMRGSKAQREHLCAVLVKRALESAIRRARAGMEEERT
jgi:xanthine dehydrogenase FAD-binding subunit